jgi:hypothetical protein
MKRSASDQTTGYLDTSLQRLSWGNIRDVFKLLKDKGLLGPLSNAALQIAYANLKRSYDKGGSEAFRQSWSKEQWWDFFRSTFDEEISTSARKAFETAEFDDAIDWDGDPQDQDVWDAAWEYFTDAYLTEIRESWMSFTPEANYFHVFIAFLIRFVVPDHVLMTRYGNYIRIHLDDLWIRYYETYNGNPLEVENFEYNTGIIEPHHATDTIEYWDEKDGSQLTVKFIYKALQDGWRFTDSKALMEMAPEPVKSQIGTCDNCKRDKARVQCGHNCKIAFYCGQECADAHYDLHKLNCK